MAKCDFSGWATRNDLLCGDGRTIKKDAFKDNDGCEVPLIWNHQHNDPDAVLGHALLENREDGVYAYCTFNDTDNGIRMKKAVRHGDIRSLSIYANKLKEIGNEVVHGTIRELSLVLAGANPGAYIDYVIAHSDGETSAIYASWDENIIIHSDDASDNKVEEEKPVAEEKKEKKEKTIGEIIDSMTDEQREAMYAVVKMAVEDDADNADNDEEDDTEMKHNLFDQDEAMDDATLMHSAMETIIADGKRFGSLKESFLEHSAEYGIDNIDWLFPEAQNLTNTPGFIKRNPDAWVDVVMNGVHHTPFSRIKMMFADLREDDARAKGYATKGALKKEEVFGLLKRTVEPTTVYKKQKLDRDDIIDITDFDVVSWLKGEMRMMLDEELARAFLFGDGRLQSSQDKIKETSIIPVIKDTSLYAIESQAATSAPKDIVKAVVMGQVKYEGSGNITLFVKNSIVTEMLLIEDAQGRRLYKDINELSLACAVNRIVKVPDTIVPEGIYGVALDLNDYNVGADKGGAVNMFDDFDIDYNQQKYLIETRCSGALTKPFSAIVIKAAQAAG